jgi:predicted nucleic acid-binding protein
MIHLDTSILIDAFTGTQRSSTSLRAVLAGPHPVNICSIVLFEWLRGPRTPQQIQVQEALFPNADTVPITSAESRIAASLYKKVKRPRGREADLMIAAAALAGGAWLWTLNPRDFKDLPGLKLWDTGT